AAGNATALTVNPATLTYVADRFSRTYGAANPAFSGSVTGFMLTDTLANATTGKLAFGSTATATSNVGGYAIDGAGLGANNGNYVFAQAPGNSTALTIDPTTLTVSADAASRLYGAANPLFSARYSGFVNGDTAAIVSGLQWATNATAATPVGNYPIFPALAAVAPNYAIRYVPGTLSVTPAPLTITAPDASRHYGEPNVFSGAVQYAGLVNGDTVASIYLPAFGSPSPQVQLASPATASSPVGAYPIVPSGFNLEPPFNYSITYAPGTLSVTRIPYTITAPDLTTLVGAVPPTVAVTTPALPSFGPQFAVYASSAFMPTGNFLNDASTPTYVLLSTIVPAANTTLGDIYAHYDIQLVPGTIKTTRPPVDPVVLKQQPVTNVLDSTTIIINPNPAVVDTPGTINLNNSDSTTNVIDNAKLKDALKAPDSKDSNVKVKYAVMDKYTLGTVVNEFGGDMLLPYVRGVLANVDGMKDMPEAQRKILEDYRDGKISTAQLSAMMASDPNALAAMMPALGKAMMDAIASGKPLSDAQQVFAGHIAENINKQRVILASELQKQVFEFEKAKAETSRNNAWALKTMPDIAMSAQQAATEQSIAAAIGAGVGLGVGISVFISVKLAAAAIFPSGIAFSTVGGVVGTAAGLVATAVSAIVIGVVSAVMVAQEQQNISAYDAAMTRAKTPVDSKLSGLDIKNDATAASEYFGAFMATMLQMN
ncbi:MAG: MBG domain-containing protein, partial [Proteobacteria bacterium]|nr:MBG domain-containing protein [Pseudomonadota bacterium]